MLMKRKEDTALSSQEFISVAVSAGCEVVDYGDHVCVKSSVDVHVMVTIPKVSYLAARLLEKAKAVLGL